MSDREEWMNLIRNEYDPAPAHYRMGDDWDDGAGRIADAILADMALFERKRTDEIETLRTKLTIAREALEFYADRSNYDCLEIGWWARAERALEEINQEAGPHPGEQKPPSQTYATFGSEEAKG